MGQRSIELHGCMKHKICAGYQQEGIDPPRVKNLPIMVRHSPQR